MQDVSTLSQNSRAVATDVIRKEATTVSVDPVTLPGSATAGASTGNNVPVVSNAADASRRERVVAESRQVVEKAIAHLNDYVQSIQRDLEFSMDEGSGAPVVRVIDRTTKTVVRQIPSDVALRLARNLKLQRDQQEYQRGYSADSRPAVDAGGGLINTRI
jgi:flagellar protein FlaG